jgi:hypothetical protein
MLDLDAFANLDEARYRLFIRLVDVADDALKDRPELLAGELDLNYGVAKGECS